VTGALLRKGTCKPHTALPILNDQCYACEREEGSTMQAPKSIIIVAPPRAPQQARKRREARTLLRTRTSFPSNEFQREQLPHSSRGHRGPRPSVPCANSSTQPCPHVPTHRRTQGRQQEKSTRRHGNPAGLCGTGSWDGQRRLLLRGAGLLGSRRCGLSHKWPAFSLVGEDALHEHLLHQWVNAELGAKLDKVLFA